MTFSIDATAKQHLCTGYKSEKINNYMFLGHTVGYYVYAVQGKYEENIEDHYGTGQVK